MKIARFFAVIFAVLGIVLMLGTAIVCFASVDATVKLVEAPTGAVECSDKLVQAIDSGDLTEASRLLYGTPDLGAEGVPADAVSAMVWAEFLDSISCTFTGKLYLKDSVFARDVSVTVLDVASVTEGIRTRSRQLLEQRVQAATDMAELYDEENNFREDLISQVLLEAAQTALRQDAKYVTRDATLTLICQDGQWWAVPDQALLDALSGGVA